MFVGLYWDDLFLILNGLFVCGYVSYGELWLFVLFLKLVLVVVLWVEFVVGDLIVILDDVFVELDEVCWV